MRLRLSMLVLAVLMLPLLVPAGASAGVGTGVTLVAGGNAVADDLIAPETQLKGPKSVTVRQLLRGVRFRVSTSEQVVGTLYMHLPTVVIQTDSRQLKPLAKRRFKLSGKRRVSLTVKRNKSKLLKGTRRVMVVFVAEDSAGNHAAPLTSYLKIKRAKKKRRS